MADESQTPEPPFALVSDLEARWHTLTEAERTRAATLIDDASDKIVAVCKRYAQLRPLTLRRVTCAMVQRAMSMPDEAVAGLTQRSNTTGPLADSWSYSTPDGALYLKKQELRDLGVGVQKAFAVDMTDGSVTP